MAKISVLLYCPKCKFPAKAESKKILKYFMYRCPKCESNVVFYNNKTDILSDQMVEYLKNNKKFKFCGNASFPKKIVKTLEDSSGGGITRDQLLDLKILLNTSTDFDDFLANL